MKKLPPEILSPPFAYWNESPSPRGDEVGLCSLNIPSRKPGAKQFKRWGTHDVLPTIRKTGGVSMMTKKWHC